MGGRTDAEKLVWVYDAIHVGLALEIVKAHHLTYAYVAEWCDVSTPTAWCWLQGHIQRPRRAHALALARLLEMLEKVPRA